MKAGKRRFTIWEKPIIKDGTLTQWGWMVKGVRELKMGRRVDIGAFTYIQAKKGVTLGDDVQIGAHTSIYSVSTIDHTKGKVTIKKGACIGSHSTIMPNVTIGQGAVIGAYSFVTTNIPPHSLAYGIPARVIKKLWLRKK